MLKSWLRIICSVLLIVSGCTKQVPTTTSYNYYITQTDNSQNITGKNIDAQTKSSVEAKNENQTKLSSTAESTTKNGLWIVFSLAMVALAAYIWYLWKGWKSLK